MSSTALTKKRVSRLKKRARILQRLEDRRLMIADAIEGLDFINHHTQGEAAQVAPPVLGGDARIVDGQVTNSFAAVGQIGSDGEGFCSGTLITPTHVLTAAHCAEGVANNRGTFIVNGQSYNTTRVVIHPDYNPSNLDNDIAIYELDRPVEGVTPHDILRTAPTVGTQLTLVGFGAGGTGANGHNGDFGTKRVGTTDIDFIEDTIIGWNFEPGESNTAPGDSGGPAFVQVNGEYVLAGVTSGGDRQDAGHGDRSFDTRVDAFADWIDSVVGVPTGGGDNGGGDNGGGDNGGGDNGGGDNGGGDNGGGDNGGGDNGDLGDDHTDNVGDNASVIELDDSGGAAIDAVFEEVGDRDVFSVEVGSGELSIELDGYDGDVDTYLRVYDAQGNLIAEDDDSGTWLNGQLDLDVQAGTYFISAGTYADSESGSYTVNVQATPSVGDVDPADPFADAVAIELNRRLIGRESGSLNAGESTMYQVTAEATGIMAFRTFGSEGLDTILRVYDSSGNLLRENDNFRGRDDSRIGMRVREGETFYVEVVAGHGSSGDFRLAVRNRASTRMARAAATDVVMNDYIRAR